MTVTRGLKPPLYAGLKTQQDSSAPARLRV